MTRTAWVVAVLAGCGQRGPVSCTALQDGRWTLDGPAMGMAMIVSLSMDAERCEFSFADWTMTMSSLPSGGVIEGTDLALDGDAHWSSCSGTVAGDGLSASGSCADDSTGFTLTAAP